MTPNMFWTFKIVFCSTAWKFSNLEMAAKLYLNFLSIFISKDNQTVLSNKLTTKWSNVCKEIKE